MHASSTSAHRTFRALSGVLLAVALALTGCTADNGAGDSDSGGDGKAAGLAPEGNEKPGENEKGVGGGRADQSGNSGAGDAGKRKPPGPADTHVIRTAKLTVRVKDVPDALDEVRRIAEDAGGIVGDENTSRDGEGRERSRLVLRVPQDAYADVLTSLEGTGKLIGRDAKARDVTDQVVDVESRVKSQRASVARVRELMDKATKLSDVVTLEGELSTRQSDLEALLAQRASLKDRTSMATITVSLTESRAAAEAKDDDDPSFTDALAGGWDAFVTALRWVGVVLAAVLPFAAVAALLLALWLRVVRPRLTRRPATAPAAPDVPAREGGDD
ncbi:DUF4349 domain-containing protein [Streptomyces sp. NPDC093510]|uniref:DUF4349 domain-containing protein n=1 Tax=Streptomyces sp. NPDC093510 TaxID=3155199 RepID=UPI0034449B95